MSMREDLDLDKIRRTIGELKNELGNAIKQADEKSLEHPDKEQEYAKSKENLEKMSELTDSIKDLIGEVTWSEVDWNSDLSDVEIGNVVDPIEIKKDFIYADLIDAGLNLDENNWIWKYIVAGKKMADLIRNNIDKETLESDPCELVEVEEGRMPENEIWLASMRERKDTLIPPTDKDVIAIVKVLVKD